MLLLLALGLHKCQMSKMMKVVARTTWILEVVSSKRRRSCGKEEMQKAHRIATVGVLKYYDFNQFIE